MGLLKFLVIITLAVLFESSFFISCLVLDWQGRPLFLIVSLHTRCASFHFLAFWLIFFVRHIQYFGFLAFVIIALILLDDFPYLENVLYFADSCFLTRTILLLFSESVLRSRNVLPILMSLLRCQLDTGVAGCRWEIVCHTLLSSLIE